ncbi:hypothetical protein OH738_34115 [Streptomyces hirsutus]|uniref:hypothetical protein n=1 Tax=Streptomyces hirsutus TaxID=35620 RepID=UPI00386E0336|nr:hypothetical protein OH738_34115 [Streptomyces hirsutus]
MKPGVHTRGSTSKQRHPQPGHLHVVQQGAAYETQAVRMTDADVANWLTDPGVIES